MNTPPPEDRSSLRPPIAKVDTGLPPTPAAEPETLPSLIETMRVEPGGAMPLLDGHLSRLRHSSAALGHACLGEPSLREQIAGAAERLDAGSGWRMRLLLAPDGCLSLETAPLPPPQPPLKVIVQGPRARGAEAWLRHKTTHRPWYQQATQWLADHPDVFDVLYWNENDEMCEGSRSNLYLQTTDGRWLTPPLEAGALPGVQRQALLRAGLVEEASIQRDDFLHAPAIRISNALRGWLDAVIVPAGV